jgi:hypothetical protein
MTAGPLTMPRCGLSIFEHSDLLRPLDALRYSNDIRPPTQNWAWPLACRERRGDLLRAIAESGVKSGRSRFVDIMRNGRQR